MTTPPPDYRSYSSANSETALTAAYMALLSRGYSLTKEKWGLLTPLTFPHERERKRAE